MAPTATPTLTTATPDLATIVNALAARLPMLDRDIEALAAEQTEHLHTLAAIKGGDSLGLLAQDDQTGADTRRQLADVEARLAGARRSRAKIVTAQELLKRQQTIKGAVSDAWPRYLHAAQRFRKAMMAAQVAYGDFGALGVKLGDLSNEHSVLDSRIGVASSWIDLEHPAEQAASVAATWRTTFENDGSNASKITRWLEELDALLERWPA